MKAAQRIYEMMQQDLSKFDDWINGELTQKFIHSGNRKVRVDPQEVPYYHYNNKDSLMTKLRSEGFCVEYKCEDRPCASPYFEIV